MEENPPSVQLLTPLPGFPSTRTAIMERRVFIHDEDLLRQCDRIPAIKSRASRVFDLINSYELLDNFTLKPSSLATRDDLLLGHSRDYVDILYEANSTDCDPQREAEEEEYGLNYDCPKIANLFEFCQRIAGGTLAAAEALLNGAEVAINWCGGWHHAERDKASGFCYINDIVIGIQRLTAKYSRILYIDLDVHHGDGVENAFSSTSRVFTLSFHQREAGFFPGTGDVHSTGFGAAKGYAANFPFREQMSGGRYLPYFKRVTSIVVEKFNPEVIVVQCGADILAGDPLGGANLSTREMGECMKVVMQFGRPLMVLGGGGYDISNSARYWTYLTAILASVELEDDIPDICDHFLSYGPTYELHVERRNVKDENNERDLEENYEIIRRNLEGIGRGRDS